MSILFEPVRIGGLTLRNRIFVAPHTTNFAGDNDISTRYVDYLRTKARGGAGLVFTEAVRVHPSSLRRFGIGGYDDPRRAGFEKLAEAVHDEGSRLFAQVMHTGRHDGSAWTGLWAPSAIPWAAGAEVPHAMTKAEIQLVIAAFRQTVQLVTEAGFDGAEIHLGHGHLLQQFLSPTTNGRTDEYGGSHENRLRLAREVLSAVHEVTGKPLGLRISADEMVPGGIGPDYAADIVAELAAEFPVAFLHVSHSAYTDQHSLSTQMADMSYGSAPFRQYPRLFKERFPELPVLAICRVDNIETATDLVTSGCADLVGMARAHIADPEISRKASEGRADEIRSCIACNQACAGHLERNLPIRCVVNPEAGMEREWQQVPAPAEARRVLVVGAGPAGLEAAVTARRRGHSVSLVDAAAEVGGQVRLIRALSGRERFGLLVDELARAARAAGVEIRLGRRVTAQQIVAGGWDEVVLATGSRPPAHPVFSHRAAIERPERLHHHVLIADGDGSWAAPGLAVHLARRGHSVRMITSLDAISPKVAVYSRLGLYAAFREWGISLSPLTRLVDDGRAMEDVTGTRTEIDRAVSVIRVDPPVADDSLARELTRAGYPNPVHLVGDAFAPRTTLEATYEGHGAGVLIGVDLSCGWQGPSLRAPYTGADHGGDLLRPGTALIPLLPS
ncbi:FAD-dependent oxidoreductase [Amycolatopsis jejuensis]|uniref:oxidoreductase n=1 Tax=Amycolatopsis jejuensis TaxID=330084 RepID=UPI00068AB8D9|nr:FAD-dependent oxidoreductase [Amycolatopsis jejuensis]